MRMHSDSFYSSIFRSSVFPVRRANSNFLLEDYVYDIMYGGRHMLKYEHTYSCTTCISSSKRTSIASEMVKQNRTSFRSLFLFQCVLLFLFVIWWAYACVFVVWPTTFYSQHKLLINGSSFSYIWMICKCCVSLACERGRIDNGMGISPKGAALFDST